MKIYSWNVNGIRACVKNGFGAFLASEKPDILGLQETKIALKDIASAKFDFPGYKEYWHPAQRPGYSGTAILVKESLLTNVVSVTNGLGNPDFDNEGRSQTLDFGSFYFINNYFPNANGELSRLGYKEKFNEVFLKYVKNLEKKKPVILCGDFNVAHQEKDLKNPKSNRGSAGFTDEERVWMTKFLKTGLVDTFRFMYPDKIQYSWWSYRFHAREKNIGWRIDYFLTSTELIKKVKQAFILDQVLGSDHAPVGIEVKISN